MGDPEDLLWLHDWTRRWIVQVVVLANDVLILGGEAMMTWRSLEEIFEVVKQLKDLVSGLQRGDSPLDSLARTIRGITDCTAYQIWEHRKKLKKELRLTMVLRDLMEASKTTACQLVHDRVYALANLSRGALISIDYAQSPAEIFAAVTSNNGIGRPLRTGFQNAKAVFEALELPWRIES